MATLISAAEFQDLGALLSKNGALDVAHNIPVRVRFDGERYFVSDDELDLYGEGPLRASGPPREHECQ